MGLTEAKTNPSPAANPKTNTEAPNPSIAATANTSEMDTQPLDFLQKTNLANPSEPPTAPAPPKMAFAEWKGGDEKGNRAKLYWLAADKCFVVAINESPKFEYFYHYSENEADINDAFAVPKKTSFQPKDAPKTIDKNYQSRAFEQLAAAQTQPQVENVSEESEEKNLLKNENDYLKPLKDWFKVADTAPQNMAMPLQLDTKTQTLKAQELYGKPDPTADKIKKALDKKQHKNSEKENIFYIVFVNKKGELAISKKGQELVRQRAQEIYDGNGLPVKVVVLEVDRGFSKGEYEMLGQKDRMTYIAASSVMADNDLMSWDKLSGGQGGYTFSTGYNLEIIPNSQKLIEHGVGFLTAASSLQGTPNFDNAQEQNPKEWKKYVNTMKELGGMADKPFDKAFWLARNAIHEGGGHGILGGAHSDDPAPYHGGKYDFLEHQSMMEVEASPELFPMDNLPKGEKLPEVAKFVPEEIKVLKEFYKPDNLEPFFPMKKPLNNEQIPKL